ncbi:polysaccharide biosynthesis/export family protein [soil metagenome]
MRHPRQTFALTAAALALTVAGCAIETASRGRSYAAYSSSPARGDGFAPIPYATWRDDEPGYRLYPGDQIDVATPSAPELNRSVTVGLDGRIQLPMVGPFMAADRSTPQLEQVLTAAYAGQLIDPRVEVSVKQAQPLRIFVGGEVGKPGVYDMPGDIDSLQASVMAGGFLTTADTHRVVVIRRGADGRAMMRQVDLGQAVRGAPRADAVPLRRFDLVYVPKSGIAVAGLFVQQYLRDLVPVQFSYALTPNSFLTTR